MWPASTNVALMPGATSTSWSYRTGRNCCSDDLGLVDRVDGLVEVDVDCRRLIAKGHLGVRGDPDVAALDGGPVERRPARGGHQTIVRHEHRRGQVGLLALVAPRGRRRRRRPRPAAASALAGPTAPAPAPVARRVPGTPAPESLRVSGASASSSSTSRPPAAARAAVVSMPAAPSLASSMAWLSASCWSRSSATAWSGCRRSQRWSRFANSSCSLPESRSTSRPARPCPRSRRSGPRNPCATTYGIRPQWSRWAWVSRIASISLRVVGQRDAVPDRFVRAALEHAAVDEDLGRGRSSGGTGSR